MIINSIWMMTGFTIWSLRNILTILELFHWNCMKGRDQDDKFWLVNFYLFTLIGYTISVVTIIVIPGTILY